MRSPGLLRLALAAGAFVIGIDAVIVSGLLPGIMAGLLTSSGEAGQLITAFGVGYVLLAPVAGQAGQRTLAPAARRSPAGGCGPGGGVVRRPVAGTWRAQLLVRGRAGAGSAADGRRRRLRW